MSAAKFWPRESRNLIGPLTIELSTEVISIPPLSPRNNQGTSLPKVKCVALINSRRSRRIVTISFSPENGVRFDARCLSPGAEKYSNSEVCIPFYRIVSRNFHLTASTSIDNMNRVVAVSAFYETKQTADEQVSFAKNDQKVNR